MPFRQDDITRGEETASPLHICRSCRRPFIVPLSIVDILDADRYVVELWCANCDERSLSPHDDAELETLDNDLVNATGQIRAALEVIEQVDELLRIDRFSSALNADLILPEDF
jgi:hypothetical protein